MSQDKCRVCLGEGLMRNIFEETRESSMISLQIMSLAKVQIYPNDGLPSTICKKCVAQLNKCKSFVQLCEESDTKLRDKLYITACSPKSEIFNSIEYHDDDSSQNLVIATEIEIDRTNITIDQTCTEERQDHRKKEKRQCTVCGKILSSGFRLQTHLRTHSGERPFQCSHCGKSFSLKPSLSLHLRLHTGEKPLKCLECNATFRHPSSLRAHTRRHSGQRPYHCLLCPKSFHTSSHLQYHVRKHTGERNFECDSCGKVFLSRGHLQQHLLLHSDDKPHMCSVCGRRLTRASHLRRHMRNLHNVKRVEVQDVDKKGDEKKRKLDQKK